MSAWWARLAAKPSSVAVGEERRDQGDVGQVGAAAVGVVEDPERPRAAARGRAPPRPRRASSRGGRGCAPPASPARRGASKSAVEQSRRSLMFGEWAERISTAPISSQAARSAPTSTWSETGSRPLAHRARSARDRPRVVHLRAPSGRQHQRRLGQLEHARPLGPLPAGGSPRSTSASSHSPANRARRSAALERALGGGRAGRGSGPGLDERQADVHQLDLAPRRRGSRNGARARRRSARRARRGRVARRRHRRARTPGRGSAARR